jgi:di/tricarboxylate transporter
MTLSMWITLLIIFLPLTLVMRGRWRMDVAALLMMAALGLAQFFGWGILGKPQTPADAILAIAGFSQPVIITLIGLFILTQALTANGMMQWMSQQMMRLGGGTEGRLIFLFAGSAALLSLLMNNVAVGALLLPGAMQVSRRTRLPPSKLLIPIAFGTALGGMATYFTTANIILSNLLINASPPQAGLDFRSFFPVGGLIALVGILYLAILGRHLLPSRQPGPEQMLARRSSAELERLYALGERLWLGRVAAHSPLVGQSLQQSRIGELLGIVVVAIWRKRQAIFNPSAAEVIQPGDMLLLVGNEQRVQRLSQWGIEIGREKENVSLSRFNVSLVEVVLAPHSSYEGKTLKALNFRRAYGFTAIALMRRGRSYRTDVGTLPLEAGDSLLMMGPSSRLRDLRANPEIILLEVEAPAPLVPRKRALFSLLLLLGAVAASVMGMPAYLAILSARQPGVTAEPAARAGSLSRHRMAGALLHCWHVRRQSGNGQHRAGSPGRRKRCPSADRERVAGAGRSCLSAFCRAHAVHGKPDYCLCDRPDCHQRCPPPRPGATAHCPGGCHRLFCLLPDAHLASGQPDYDEPRQLPLWRFRASWAWIDGAHFSDPARRAGSLLAFIVAAQNSLTVRD